MLPAAVLGLTRGGGPGAGAGWGLGLLFPPGLLVGGNNLVGPLRWGDRAAVTLHACRHRWA
eukprot:2935157-Lingulodinium_polyedra.AAC.1